MNDTWDLSILYKGFDDPAFTGDMAALDAAIRSMNDLAAQAAALPHADLVHRYVDGQLQLTTLISKLFIFCSLRTSANTADNQANSLSDQISAKISGCAAATPPCATPWPPSTIWTPSSTPTPPWRSIAICCGTSAGTASTSCPTRRRSCSPG